MSGRVTTVGQCGRFCSLAGSLVITAGLDWSDELLHTFTDKFRRSVDSLQKALDNAFSQVYFGDAFEFSTVEAFSENDGSVNADFFLQFSGIAFNVTTEDVKESFMQQLRKEDGKSFLSKFELDLEESYFIVVDTDQGGRVESLVLGKHGVELPDWAWLVVMGGIVTLLIISVIGVSFTIQRVRQGYNMKKRFVSVQALDALRGERSLDADLIDTSKVQNLTYWESWKGLRSFCLPITALTLISCLFVFIPLCAGV